MGATARFREVDRAGPEACAPAGNLASDSESASIASRAGLPTLVDQVQQPAHGVLDLRLVEAAQRSL